MGSRLANLSSSQRKRHRARGAVMVEYLVILGFVSLTVATAIAGIGPTLLNSYKRARAILISPFP